MPPRCLPAELDDIVIDHLYDDNETLAACALVCHSWLPTSRHHIWRELHLDFSAKGLDRLHQLLSSSPHLTCVVREVVLTQDEHESYRIHEPPLLPSILTALARLPALTSLALHGLSISTPYGEPYSQDQLVLPGVRILTINDCAFSDFLDIQQVCNAFPNLASLGLNGLWWECCASNAGAPRASRNSVPLSALTDVSLGDCFSRNRVTSWLLDTMPAHTLRTLRLPIVSVYDTRLPELLAAAGTSLEHLDVGSPSPSDDTANYRLVNVEDPAELEPYLDLTHNTALRSLTLGVPTFRDMRFVAPWLTAVLQKISSPVFEEVRFAMTAYTAQREVFLAKFKWDDVVDILARLPLPGIKKVVFVVRGSRHVSHKCTKTSVELERILRWAVYPHFEPLAKKKIEVVSQFE